MCVTTRYLQQGSCSHYLWSYNLPWVWGCFLQAVCAVAAWKPWWRIRKLSSVDNYISWVLTVQLWEKMYFFLIHSRIHTQNKRKLAWFPISMCDGFSKHLLHLYSSKSQSTSQIDSRVKCHFYNSICCWWPVFSSSSSTYTSLCLKSFPALLSVAFPPLFL